MAKNNLDFNFSPDDYWDSSDLSGCFRCDTCWTHIPRNMSADKNTSIKEAKDNSPSWRFYKNSFFCSEICETKYLSAPFNPKLEQLSSRLVNDEP